MVRLAKKMPSDGVRNVGILPLCNPWSASFTTCRVDRSSAILIGARPVAFWTELMQSAKKKEIWVSGVVHNSGWGKMRVMRLKNLWRSARKGR